jgi:hypothetical protein
MLILSRCDSTNNRIILLYYYEITYLLLLRCMKQVKLGNIKDKWNIQKGV